MTAAAGKITADDLLDTLAAADALETFLHLPREDQDNFARWIGKARDEESHWRRINALVIAMKIGPLETGTADASTQGG